MPLSQTCPLPAQNSVGTDRVHSTVGLYPGPRCCWWGGPWSWQKRVGEWGRGGRGPRAWAEPPGLPLRGRLNVSATASDIRRQTHFSDCRHQLITILVADTVAQSALHPKERASVRTIGASARSAPPCAAGCATKRRPPRGCEHALPVTACKPFAPSKAIRPNHAHAPAHAPCAGTGCSSKQSRAAQGPAW